MDNEIELYYVGYNLDDARRYDPYTDWWKARLAASASNLKAYTVIVTVHWDKVEEML